MRETADIARPTKRQLAAELGHVVRDLPAFAAAPLCRGWHLRWGATPAEVAAVMPGDALFPRAGYRSTRAITIGAPPDWLAVAGAGRLPAGRVLQ